MSEPKSLKNLAASAKKMKKPCLLYRVEDADLARKTATALGIGAVLNDHVLVGEVMLMDLGYVYQMPPSTFGDEFAHDLSFKYTMQFGIARIKPSLQHMMRLVCLTCGKGFPMDGQAFIEIMAQDGFVECSKCAPPVRILR